MEEQQPTVGRIVHYVSYGTPGGEYGKECRAAIVTAVDGSRVSLAVLNPTGMFFNESVRHKAVKLNDDEDDFDFGYMDGGTWHWPERA